MNRVRVSQKLPWGGGYLDNKLYPLTKYKIKEVVFVVETTFSRVHLLNPPDECILIGKEDEWR